jgi:DNA (cytosine-5)-methyltransferase 1
MQDPRGNLTLTYLGLVDKLKPRWVVYENVPGLLSSNGGRDFGSFVGALGQLGYGWAMRILDAQHFGVPQRRRRVFVVACLGDWRAAAEVLSLREGLRGYLETGNKKRKSPAADAGAGVEAGSLIGGIDYEHNAHGPNDVTGPLLKGSPTGGGHPLPAIAYRKSKRACSTTDNETWVPADASNTLNNFDLGDTRTTHAVVQPVAWTQNQREEVRLLGDKVGAIALPGTHQTNYIAEPKVYENHPNDSRITGPLDVAPTVVSRFGTGGGNVPLVNNEAVTFQPGNLRREAGADPSFTTTTTTLKASAGDQTPHVAIPPMAVRRLTPVECERLQGFHDNWSRISWKGKPAEECPDGPRYKACGNSMAVPVMRWIGERIAAVDATLSTNA